MLLESLDYKLFIDEDKFNRLSKKIDGKIKKANNAHKVQLKQASLPLLEQKEFKFVEQCETDKVVA